MKTNCNIIKDLLPLYIDGIASKETIKLVDEHLAECKNCKEALENMKEEIRVSDIDEKNAIKNFFKKIKRKKRIAITLSVIITLILVIGGVNLWNKENFIRNYEENLITVEEQDDGGLIANINATNYTDLHFILEQNIDDSVDIYITLFQSFKDKLFPTEEQFKSISGSSKCWGSFMDENIEFNEVLENNMWKIIFHPKNDIKIANIYYLETNEKYKTIAYSNETCDPAFDMIRVWKNNNLPFVFLGYWSPSQISTIDIEQAQELADEKTMKKATVNREDVYPNTELSPMLDIINILNSINFKDETCNEAADYYIKINTPEKGNVFTYGLEMTDSGYHITAVIDGKAKEAVLSSDYQNWIDDVIHYYFNK